ncbi:MULTISPECIES: hypothetical protein [Borreliella]|uniref:hypothetical protein n=2 Tax=Borreliella TaxID=64895 RepID=UPI0004E7EABA|nr:hypothetical protein [Borreliella valaisiana]AIJ30253.1 hypothetical protein P613_04735 [Borreliella valaisiana Tom4006]WLN25683.1 hypothetical protein KJD10_04450 [Borreliella valaisiana]
MRSKCFYICLFPALIFIFSCNLGSGVKLTDSERSEVLKNVKDHYKGDPAKKSRVDEYFKQVGDSKRDVILNLFSVGFKYVEAKENKNKKPVDLKALESDFKSKLKQLNYTEEEFEKLVEEFDNFVDPKTTK